MIPQKKVKFYFLTLILIPIIVSCVHSLPATPETGKRVQIAIVPASNKTVDHKIAEMLTTALKKENYFVIVEKNKINKVFDEQQFQYSGISNESTLVKLGHLFNAQYVILGELIDIQKSQSSSSVVIGVYTTKISAKIINVKDNSLTAVASETGSSLTGGFAVDAAVQGKTTQELIGLKRTEDDMFNVALRSATENLANVIINAIYNKDKRFIDADTHPNIYIEKWTKQRRDNKSFQAAGKLYSVQFDDVWAATNQYFKGNIMTADKSNGIIITKIYSPGWSSDRWQVYVLVEKESLNGTKLTVKGFCYQYNVECVNPGYKIWQKEWQAWNDSCYNMLYATGSKVIINNLTKTIRDHIEKQGR